jgi:hypothetical protein
MPAKPPSRTQLGRQDPSHPSAGIHRVQPEARAFVFTFKGLGQPSGQTAFVFGPPDRLARISSEVDTVTPGRHAVLSRARVFWVLALESGVDESACGGTSRGHNRPRWEHIERIAADESL